MTLREKTALEEAVLLLLGYEQGQYEKDSYRRPILHPNPFEQAITKLQAEILKRSD
ncbi:hypothetical protein LCGC14_2630270 [marine sediment metagenome]|uniref:Uncharacterized protein n=1 Tax=marine sediment metagenome TaxID=412755 RepID=A0A0F9A0L5_9ZZZZ